MIELDARSAQADLRRMQAELDPPRSLGAYTLTGLIARTETALVYAARGGVFGSSEGVLKLTASGYAPLLVRELELLVEHANAEVDGVIRPVSHVPLRLTTPALRGIQAVAMALPFCLGGTLVSLIARRAVRAGWTGMARRAGNYGPGCGLALEIGLHVGGILRALLALRQPLVHGDVRPQNVLLPTPDAPLEQLTLVDFDAARQLNGPLPAVANDPDAAESLAEDVRGFGELLFQVATGRESSDDDHNPLTGNGAFNDLVARCLAGRAPQTDHLAPATPGYVCMADEALWHDLYRALDIQSRRTWASSRSVWSRFIHR